MTEISSLLKEYPFISLMFTGLIGALAFQVRKMPGRLWRMLMLNFSTELYVDEKCEAFFLMEKWISENSSILARNRSLALSSATPTTRYRDITDKEIAAWWLTPGSTTSFFVHRGVFVIFTKKVPLQDGSRENLVSRSYTLLFLTRSHKYVEDFVANLGTSMIEEGDIAIYNHSGRGGQSTWYPIAAKKPRALDTIFLSDGQKERILADIDWFIESKDWYNERGIAYRRGYLFSGPPGTGKTSLLLSLCGHYKRPLCIANINTFSGDAELQSAIVSLPKNAMVVFEDIDRIEAAGDTENEEEKEKEEDRLTERRNNKKKVSASAVLNALDGVLTPEGRIFILTTNYPERLDPVLIRPGRVDVHEVIGPLGINEQLKMAAHFYKDPTGYVGTPKGITPSVLQRAFMLHPNDPKKANEFIVEDTTQVKHLAV